MPYGGVTYIRPALLVFFLEVFVSCTEHDRHVDPSVAASDQYAATVPLFRVQRSHSTLYLDNRASESHEGRFDVEEEGPISSPRDVAHVPSQEQMRKAGSGQCCFAFVLRTIICFFVLRTNFRTPDFWSPRNERSD
jgi:hypothetical protein